jgi:hypothetical protein
MADAAVVARDPADSDLAAIRRLGSPAEAERHAALAHVYERWEVHSRTMARGRVRRFYQKAWGGELDDLAEEGAAQGWARLANRVLDSPLTLSEPVDKTFESFLRRCIGSAIVDHLRRLRTGPRLVSALQQVQAALADPAHRQWMQEMIDRRRAGLPWDDVVELARTTGIDEPVLERFLDDQVRPALARQVLPPPPAPADTVLTRLERRDLLTRLLDRVDELFGERTKGHHVASAILRVLFTRPAVKGEATLDHEMLMGELEAMGEPWKSDGCRAPHAPGFPDAARCKSCANALHQWRTRVTQRFRNDALFQEAADLLRDDAMFRGIAGRRQGDEPFAVSSDEGFDTEGAEGGGTGHGPEDRS